MPAAYFVVRATVSDPAKRAAFDRWYSKEHPPDAAKSFGVEKAWRFWSISDPSLHQATYQFADQAALDRAMNGDDLKRLVADFNRDWPDITRVKDGANVLRNSGAGGYGSRRSLGRRFIYLSLLHFGEAVLFAMPLCLAS